MSYDRRYDQYAPYYQQHPEHGGHGSYGERPPSKGSYHSGQYQSLSAYQSYTPQNTLPNPNTASNTFNNERSTSANKNAPQSAQDAGSEYSQGHIPATSMNHGHSVHTSVTESNGDRYAPNSAARISYAQQRVNPWRENNQTASSSLPRYVQDRYDSSAATTNYQKVEMMRGGQNNHRGSTFPTSQTLQHPQERNHSPQPGYQHMRSTNRAESQQAHSREPYRNMPPTTNTSTSVQSDKNLGSSEHGGNLRFNAPQAQMPPTAKYQTSSEGLLSQAPKFHPQPASAPSATVPVSQQTQRDHQPARQVPNSSHVTTSNPNQVNMTQQNSTSDVRTNSQVPYTHSLETISRPTTVDPRSISNHQEYQRRQDAGAEKRRAADVIATADSNQTSRLSSHSCDQEVSLSSKARAESSSHSASGMKDQMESEMKQMLDRMREYKAKDPTLFSQIWEQVKKGQPSQAVSSPAQAFAASASPIVDQQKFPSPPVHVSSERAEAEPQSSFPPGFDRGRFPYQRRRRGGRVSVVASRQDKSGDGQIRTAGQTPILPVNGQSQPGSTLQRTPAPVARDESHERIVVATKESRENANSEKRPKLPAASRTLADKERDLTDERLVAAMAEFNKSLGTQQKAFNAAPFPPPAQTLPPRPPRPPGPPGPPGFSVTAEQARVPNASVRPRHDIRNPGEGPQSNIGSTVWPEHKKEALAAAAANILNANYGKDGKTISPVSVHYLLDQNPSYIQLCETLENRGFALDRRFFARALLSAVPDLNSTMTQKSSHPEDRPHSATEAPPRPLSQDPRSLKGPSGNVQGPVKLPPEPVTKHDKARKRNFSEIIDLSEGRSDDDDVRHHSVPQQYPASVAPLKPSSGPVPEAGGKAIAIRPSRRDHVRSEVVVQPLNKRRDAFRRSLYDPRTICRDILISCGKHPTEAPLNAHLNILRERFDTVNYESDLRTLRWDILDPEGEKLEESEQDDAEISHHEIGDENPAPELSFVKEEVAREGPASMNSSSKRPTPVIVQISPSTTPSRRGRPPKNPSANSQNSTPPLMNRREPESKPLATSLDKAAFIRSYSFTPAATSEVSLRTPNPPSSGLPSPFATAKSVRVPGRIGRPPGAKNKKPRPDKGIPKKRPMQFEPTDRSSPSKPTTPLGSAAKEKLTRPQNNASSPSAGISIVLPTRSPSIAQSQSNLLHRQKVPVPDHHDSRGVNIEATPSSGPTFEAHKCRWEGCPAELHNLETLWKHIRKHRTRLEKPYTCKWAGCGVDGGGRFRTPDMEAWDRHTETAHLRSFVRTG